MRSEEVSGTTIILGTILLIAIIGFVFFKSSETNHYKLPEHHYKIAVKGEQAMDLRADYIDRRDGCVIFYRDGRIDTLLCENMEPVLVTEVYE